MVKSAIIATLETLRRVTTAIIGLEGVGEGAEEEPESN
jgi:hypothetical protein